LAVGLELDDLLKYNGFEVVSTRTKDVFVELKDRTDMINRAKCDVVVSVHVNSSTGTSPNYVSVFIQGNGGKAEILANYIQRHLTKNTAWPDGGVRVQNLHMTRETNMPAVLVELGFISNPAQEKWLKEPDNQKKLARSITQGICDFAGKPYKEKEEKENLSSIEPKVVYKGKTFPGKIIDDKAYVEIRALAELFGLKVVYYNDTKTTVLL
jgi:N-acetylmuramoyl-L-alanine amidase